MRVDPNEHRRRNYRVQSLVPDFELLDVWAFPIEARPSKGETFELFLRTFRGANAESGSSRASRFLFWLRGVLGKLFGWDKEMNTLPIPGCRETSLRDRLTEAECLQQAPVWQTADELKPDLEFRVVYHDEREHALELSNRTVHAILHLSWVALAPDKARPELAVYVKHRGKGGRLYMALIAPFRHFIVYPAMMRQAKRAWERRLMLGPLVAGRLEPGIGQ